MVRDPTTQQELAKVVGATVGRAAGCWLFCPGVSCGGVLVVGTRQTGGNDRIKKATQVLVGKALWQCTRAADLASFDFGDRRSVPSRAGGTKIVGEYALHVQCAWRITHCDQVVVGSRDLYYPAGYGDQNREIPADFDWDRDLNRRDSLLRLLFENGKKQFTVDAVEVGTAADLRIVLRDGSCLEIFPDDSLNDERWRLFRPGIDESHFVVTGRGVET